MVNKPAKPLDFIINQLSIVEPIRRIFIMGQPGTFRKENATHIADHFGWKCIDAGELLRREVNKKSEVGKKIQDAFRGYRFVDDSIVVDLVKKEIEMCESEKMSWVIQGFPRTKVQALSL